MIKVSGKLLLSAAFLIQGIFSMYRLGDAFPNPSMLDDLALIPLFVVMLGLSVSFGMAGVEDYED